MVKIMKNNIKGIFVLVFIFTLVNIFYFFKNGMWNKDFMLISIIIVLFFLLGNAIFKRLFKK